MITLPKFLKKKIAGLAQIDEICEISFPRKLIPLRYNYYFSSLELITWNLLEFLNEIFNS